MTRTDLADLVAATPTENLPALVGELEAAKATAWARMMGAAPAPHANTEAPDRNLSAEEAATRLGLSKDYLYRNAKHLPFARRIGRRVVFSERGLDRWNRSRSWRA